MIKKTASLGLAIMLLLALTISGCGTSSSGSSTNTTNNQTQPATTDKQPITLVVGHTGTEGNSVYVFFHKLKEEVEKRSDGQIILEVHDAGVLGGDNQLVDGLKLGSIDIASSASSNMATFTQDLMALDLPYIFQSRESAHKVLNGEIGQQLLDKTTESAGTKAMAFIATGGFRLLNNTKLEAKTPADIAGLKLRTTQSPIEVELTKAWGASPTTVDWGETYTAVEQKMVDGLQLQPNWTVLNGFADVIKYATKVKALMAFHVVQFNKAKWDSLTPEQQRIIEESVIAARDEANKADQESENSFIQQLEQKGVSVYEPSEQEISQWKEPGVKVWDQFKEKIDQKLIEDIVQSQ